MTMQFRAAEKAKAKLRLALVGPSGSGKTYTALALAQGLAGDDGRFCVIDTEHGSASLYADLFAFDVLELDEFSPDTYVRAIHAGESAGYAAIVIDSLSHAWEGTGGALDMADKATKRSNSGNSYMAWRDVTPHHNALVEAMISSRTHVIATMRVKTEYVIEEQNGKKVPRRVGLAPVQRAGMEYEFAVLGDMNRDHELVISKTRIPFLDGAIIAKPDAELARSMLRWLDSGGEVAPRVAEPPKEDQENARKHFHARARELGYPSQVAIHTALGLDPSAGALAAVVAGTWGGDWSRPLEELEAKGPYQPPTNGGMQTDEQEGQPSEATAIRTMPDGIANASQFMQAAINAFGLTPPQIEAQLREKAGWHHWAAVTGGRYAELWAVLQPEQQAAEVHA